MIAVSQQGTSIVMLAVKGAGFVPVIDGQDESAIESAPGAFDPVARLKANFRLLSLFERNSLLGKIIRKRRHGRLASHLGESLAFDPHVNFAQRPASENDAVHRQSVQQFI